MSLRTEMLRSQKPVKAARTVPCAEAVSEGRQRLVGQDCLAIALVLFRFPHPSDVNSHRERRLSNRESALSKRGKEWFAH